MENLRNKAIKTLIVASTVIFLSIFIVILTTKNGGNEIPEIVSTCGLLIVSSVSYVLFRYFEDKRRKQLKVLVTIEKSPREINKWIRKNYEWIEWIIKTDDNNILADFKNNIDGSVSEEKMKSLKLYREFEVVYENEWKDINQFFRLIPSHFVSSEYRRLLYQSLEVEKSVETSFYAFKEDHINSQEHILTLRKQTKELIRIIYLVVNELTKLDNQEFAESVAPSREVKLISSLRKRRTFFVQNRMITNLFDALIGREEETKDQMIARIQETYKLKQPENKQG